MVYTIFTRQIHLAIFLSIWISCVVECSPTTSLTPVTCSPPYQLCGSKYCYDPATERCTSSNVTCINQCGNRCYDSSRQSCINGTICPYIVDPALCEVKYDNYGRLIIPPQLQCYQSRYEKCLNHTLCSSSRVCNQKCMLYTSGNQVQICVDNQTVCNVPYRPNGYQPNQIQVCNGTCYDTQYFPFQHCVDGIMQCISNCSNTCYNVITQQCLNGTICDLTQKGCLVSIDPYYGNSIVPSRVMCYNPRYEKCLNNTVCSKSRICNGQCMFHYTHINQVCANDKRTICNVTKQYGSYRPYQVHLCNDKCYDTATQQCVDGVVSCIEDICGNECYICSQETCHNGTLCPINRDACEIKAYSNNGSYISSSVQCYDPYSYKCLNHTLCSSHLACGQQCMSNQNYQLCVDNTICNLSRPISNYVSNQLQLCNGSCYDRENPPGKHCVNGIVQCISSCSDICYDKITQICINGTICHLSQNLCQVLSGLQCYDPRYDTCLNQTLCRLERVCGQQCITNSYQVCANDQHTICNVTNTYNNYQPNQMQLCNGVCFDSHIQKCTEEIVIPCAVDPLTNQCLPQIANYSTTTNPISILTSTTSSFSTITDSSTIITSTTSSTTSSTTTSSTTSSITTSSTTSSITTSSTTSSITTSLTTTTDTDSPTTFTSTASSTATISTDSSTTSTSTTFSTTSSSITSTTSAVIISSTVFINATSSTTTTMTLSTTTMFPPSNTCCVVQQCTQDSDCCISGAECQCYRHNQDYGYGSCLNPNIKPICAEGCPAEVVCLSDTDCCKCQCGSITVTNVNGSTITRKQCVPR